MPASAGASSLHCIASYDPHSEYHSSPGANLELKVKLGSAVSEAALFSFAAPAVSGVTPAEGVPTPGGVVVIAGTNFQVGLCFVCVSGVSLARVPGDCAGRAGLCADGAHVRSRRHAAAGVQHADHVSQSYHSAWVLKPLACCLGGACSVSAANCCGAPLTVEVKLAGQSGTFAYQSRRELWWLIRLCCPFCDRWFLWLAGPRVQSVKGCDDTQSGDGTRRCNTAGGTRITVTGTFSVFPVCSVLTSSSFV